jgi:hypothetical protein
MDRFKADFSIMSGRGMVLNGSHCNNKTLCDIIVFPKEIKIPVRRLKVLWSFQNWYFCFSVKDEFPEDADAIQLTQATNTTGIDVKGTPN